MFSVGTYSLKGFETMCQGVCKYLEGLREGSIGVEAVLTKGAKTTAMVVFEDLLEVDWVKLRGDLKGRAHSKAEGKGKQS